MIRVRVLMATGCHLCPPGVEAARRACAARGAELAVVDIDGDLELERRYREAIPVVEVEGREVGRFAVDESAIAAAIDAA
jgi:hypothetical protein